MKELFFKVGVWFGKGTISFNFYEEPLPVWIRFAMTRSGQNEGIISSSIEYHIHGHDQPITNRYTFASLYKDHFDVSIENYAWGKAEGRGFIEEKMIGFEFTMGDHGFEGYESYTFLDDKTILFKTEFHTDQGLRSEIVATVTKNVESTVTSG